MVRKTLDRLRHRSASGPALSAEVQASNDAERYLQACAANSVTPNGGPFTADDLARRAAKLRAEG